MFNSKKSSDIRKILIFRLGAIGDIVHTTALYRSLKKHNPHLSIQYLTGIVPSLLINNDPDLDQVWIAEQKSYKYLSKLAKKLKKEEFDLFINLQPSIRTKIFSYLIKAKKNLTYKKTFKLHAVENFWITAKPLFKDSEIDKEITIYIPDEIREKTADLISENTIGLNIGANNARQGRKWPIEHWKELTKELIDKYDYKIVLTGSAEDEKLAKELLSISSDISSFCGKLSILESAAILSKCKFVVSGDTGPLHIATAVGTPVIGLYGSMPIKRTGPYGSNHHTIASDRECVPCNRRKCGFTKKKEQNTPCMEDITPEKVLNIIKNNFDNN